MAYTDIDDPSVYFQTALYTGNGGTLAVTNDGNSDMQPDWVWAKSRTQGNSHVFFDVVRTFAGDKEIQSNNTGAEGASDSAGYGYISAVGSDGFTAQAGSTAGDYTNVSSQNYVAWQWKAGTSFTNDASSTSIGTIDSAGSVNTDAGFSIISYTGTGSAATIAHGLGVIPKFYLIKNRTNARNWQSYHEPLGNQAYLRLNTTAAAATGAAIWNNTSPTSSVFSIGTSDFNAVNADGDNYIAYCFAEKQGYSKFGSYTGNGNADGTFVYTGFKPAWVMIKNTTTAGKHWVIHDNKRNTFNPTNKELVAQGSGEEVDDTRFDFLSNGLKIRDSASYVNTSGDIYIYIAFAENPFVTSTGVPATAR